jgi:ankyrin repeat protein
MNLIDICRHQSTENVLEYLNSHPETNLIEKDKVRNDYLFYLICFLIFKLYLKFGNTALHYACTRGDININTVLLLIERGADVNIIDNVSIIIEYILIFSFVCI